MHIPDGFLDPIWCIITYIIFILYLALSIRKIKDKDLADNITLVSVLAAGIFAAQMLNWPLPGGTSLHFVGGALAGIMLGPYYGFLSLTLVLLVQTLVFHDGGITALGANIFNMAIIDVLAGYLIYKLFIRFFGENSKSQFIGAFIGSWLGIFLAGVMCGLEIGLSPQFPYGIMISVPVMGIWHGILGVIEGFITATVIIYVTAKSPQLILGR